MIRVIPQLLIPLAVLTGCDNSDRGPAAGASSRAPATQGTGIVRGRVTLSGWTAPLPPPMTIKCGDQTLTMRDEAVVVGPDQALKGVVVWISDAPPSGAVVSQQPVVLDQQGCVYRPHVVALRVGQPLRVRSSDQTLHNVHMLTEANAPVNLGMMKPAEKDVRFKVPERFRVRCDVHPWMSANVAVFEHPYFAVSDENGRFEITGLPAGPYTVKAWQERFGELDRRITVHETQPADLTLVFGPPAAN